MKHPAIRIRNISKRYRIGSLREPYSTLRDTLMRAITTPLRRRQSNREENYAWALQDVSFDVAAGEVVGIIGRNGAGKSTLLKILSRITEPTRGHAEIHGRLGALLEVGTGFHNELTGRENIYLSGIILGMKRTEISRMFNDIVDFAEVERFIDTPVKHYSSGMQMRLAFAVAAHLQPEILIVDEVLAVGDEMFQKKCLGKMGDVAKQGRTILFVSHNMAAIRSLCTRGVFLNSGRVAYSGEVNSCIEAYFRAIGALPPEEGVAVESENNRNCFGPVSLCSNQGNTVLQSDPIRLSTTLRTNENASGFTLRCVLEDMQGRRIFNLHSNSASLGCKVGAAGQFEVHIEIPPLWLNPGVYSVWFHADFWGKYGASKHSSERFPIDVDGKNGAQGVVLHPQVDWLVRPKSGSL